MQNNAAAKDLIKGTAGDWEVVIGLEVHAQVASKAKLFSGASTEFGGEPNSHVSLVDAAMPGMLPVINERCVAQAVRTGLGLKAKVNLTSVFDRKNYFYPDLPQGYQISQYKSPIVGEGQVEINVDGNTLKVGIERLHLEQDAGKSIHDQHPELTLVDLNRSGVALMEIVSRPDMRSAKQAQAYVSKLRTILRYLGTCDGDMEKGNLRADVNVSVRKPGDAFGTRCEIKNVNSIRFIGQAVEVEARRQIDILEDGGKIDQETRLFDPDRGETRSMRSKEEAHDYRYFPDPDLLPLELTQDYVDGLKKSLPELPDEKKQRFMEDYKLSAYDADVLVADKERADYFEGAYQAAKQNMGSTQTISPDSIPSSASVGETTVILILAKNTANTVINELMGRLNKEGKEISSSPITSRQLGVVASLATSGVISSRGAKTVLDTLWISGGDPVEIVEQRGLKQVTDTGAIEKAVDAVIGANPDKVADAKSNPKAIGWFVGQVMKVTGGKANPQAINELLRARLEIPTNEPSMEVKKGASAVLFDGRQRVRKEPLRPGEDLFTFYDECGRSAYDELRSTLNRWLSEIPHEPRIELISRMRNAGNAAFGAALCELMVHALLVRLHHRVAVHPPIQGTEKRPDFAVIDDRGKVVCYVEVKTANRSVQEHGELGRETAIYNAINKASLPAGCLLGYELIRAGSDSPTLGPLVKSIERWARENKNRAATDELVQRFTAGGWIIELQLFSGGSSAPGGEAIGVASMRGGVIAPHKDIRGAIEEKTRRYGAMGAPFMIVVADAKEQLFNESHIKTAVTEAVFGDEQIVFAGDTFEHDYSKNGIWNGPSGPRNKHVSAVLLLPKTGIWKLREENWQPIMAINPWATFPIPDSIKQLKRLEAIDGRWVLRDGPLFADILGLPTPWPPVD